MLKKGIKLISIFLIIFLIMNIVVLNNKCFAESIDVTENPAYWSSITSSGSDATFNTMIRNIVKTVRTVGLIVSIVALSCIGVKFMLGSVEEKAQYRKTLFPWFIGAIMVFAISFIPSLVLKVTNNLF